MIISKLKSFLKPGASVTFTEVPNEAAKASEAPTGVTVHSTPAGRFPLEAPHPSKVAVLLYYISCVFCMIGTIMTVRSFFLHDVSGDF